MIAEAAPKISTLSATVDRKAFASAITIAEKASAGVKAHPIANHVRLIVTEDSVTVEGTDLGAWAARLTVPVAGLSGAEPGAVCVRGDLLAGVARTFDGEHLSLALAGGQLQISGQGRTARLSIRDAEDFPPLEVAGLARVGRFDPIILKASLARVTWAIAREASRPVLTGAHFKIEGHTLTMAAADGFCLAVMETPLVLEADPPADGWAGIIDGAGLRALVSNDWPDGPYALNAGAGRLVFDGPGAQLIAQLVPGKFPDYPQLIPAQVSSGVRLDTDELGAVIRRAKTLRDGLGMLRLRTVAGALETLRLEDGQTIEDRIETDTTAIEHPWRTVVNLAKFESAIAACGAEAVWMQPGGETPDERNPVRLWTDDGWIAVVMPMYAEAHPAGWREGVGS